MPVTKNALIRYHTLDKCFRNSGRMYFAEDLIEECNRAIQDIEPSSKGISRRQLFYDIRFMESEQGWSIPLEKHIFGKRRYYRYSDTSFSISNQPLNESEANQLKSALLVLSRFKGLPQFDWVNELILKLEQSFSLKQNAAEVLFFETNQYLKGIHFLGELFNGIIYKKVLMIDYQSFKSMESKTYEIHPWFLKQFNNRWFLFGFNPEVNNISNLALDRIIEVREGSKTYIGNTQYDGNEYFEDIIGVTIPPDGILTKIEILVKSIRVPYIRTKPVHGSQKEIGKKDDDLIIQLELIPNFEFENMVMSFGADMVILKPESIRAKISSLLEEAILLYQKETN